MEKPNEEMNKENPLLHMDFNIYMAERDVLSICMRWLDCNNFVSEKILIHTLKCNVIRLREMKMQKERFINEQEKANKTKTNSENSKG